MRRVHWLLPAAVAAAAGCATTISVIQDGRGVTGPPVAVAAGAPAVDLTVCVESAADGFNKGYRDSLAAKLAGMLAAHFRRAFPAPVPAGVLCDARVAVSSWMSMDVYAANSGRLLFNVGCNAMGDEAGGASAGVVGEIYRRLSPAGAFYEQLRGDRALAAAPRAAPAAEPAAPPASDVDEPSYRVRERAQDAAVVVGIETYSDLPEAPFAEQDARAVKTHLLALGVPERNIALLLGSNAGKASI
ncbi:MAG: hypothetical protein PHU21_08900, partial [Elusimicrobia bacterium]|nr:hypothetical protein [Elusimicrobiota bacterium]